VYEAIAMAKARERANSAAPVATRPPAVMRVKKGEKVVCEGRAAKVLAIVSASQIWISYLGLNEEEWVSLEDLTPYNEIDPANPSKPEVLIEDDFEFERAAEWVRAFERFKGCTTLTPQVKATICDELGVSRRTVDRHFALYQLDSGPRGQLPLKSGPEKGSSYLAKAALAIIDKAIGERYVTEERGSIQATADLARSRCDAAGFSPPPSYNTVLARIQTLDQWKLARARHGRVRGDAKAGPAGDGLKAHLKPLEFVQMDHAIVDVIVVDPDTREEIGRPWITLAIDVATRCILGFYLTFDAPSQTSVALALEQCCLPKDSWLKSLGIDEPWLPFGLMKTIGWDNAKCFRNTNLVAACREENIDPRFRRVRNPTHGAHIERVIGTYMGRIHLIKGTTFSNTKDREDYRSAEKAIMTLHELTVWTVHEINGRYHNARHSSLGRTPLEAWNEAWTQDGALRLPPIPANRRKFRLSLFPRIERTVTREGLNRFGLKYWDEGLIPLIGAKQKFWVAHDPRNISRLHLLFKDDWIDVPWRDRNRAPIALWEWERAKTELRKKHNTPASNAAVFKHIEAQREIELQAEKTTRQQRRDRQRRPKDDRPKKNHAAIDYSVPPVLISNPMEAGRGHVD
jgi:putative transposase